MGKSVATGAELVRVCSHYVDTDYTRELAKEECYPELTATWRGETIEVRMSCDRYRHSNGMSEWRVYVRDTKPGTSDIARTALREVCEPIAREWLASDAYRESRRRAFASMIRRALRDERYSADRPAEVLATFKDELAPEDHALFAEAIDHLRLYLAALETPAA